MKRPLLLALLALPLLANALNYIPDGGFEHGLQPVFHRMLDADYMQKSPSLETTGAFEGQKCARITSKCSLLLYSEVNLFVPQPKSPWTFSIYLKADKPDTKVTLSVGIYRQWDHVDTRQTVSVGTEWSRHEITIQKWTYGRRSGTNQGPVNFSVTVPKDATVWADAAQWEQAPSATAYNSSFYENPTKVQSWTPFPSVPWFSETPRPLASAQPLDIPLFVQNDEANLLPATPLSTGILFPKGTLGAGGSFRIATDTGEVPCQFRPLALFEQDGSVLAGQIDFIADLKPGRNEFRLRYDPKGMPDAYIHAPFESLPQPGDTRLWKTIASLPFQGAQVHGLDAKGSRYTGVVTDTSPLFQGPVHAYYAVRGHLVRDSCPAEGLLAFSARIHSWKGVPGITVDLTLENRDPHRTVLLRQVGWDSELITAPAYASVLQNFCPGTNTFSFGTSSAPGKWIYEKDVRGEAALTASVATRTILLQTQDSWRMHPTAVAFRDGCACADLWPFQARPLLFSPGMAATRTSHILAFPQGADADLFRKRLERPPLLQVAPEWSIRTGLPIPLATSPKTPVLNKYLADFIANGTLNPEIPETRYWYGVFDYGDKRGDGGWSNLESYTDYTLELRGLAQGDSQVLRLGHEGARHYRDMDIDHNTGLPHLHSTNHVNGPSHFGHSWIQGVLLHYLITGDLRSREVAYHASQSILEFPIESDQIRENRELAYFLLTLSDISLVFGSRRPHQRMIQQIEHAKKLLTAEPTPSDDLMKRTAEHRGNSLFWWSNSGIVPFACWYGTAGMLKMYALTGDEALLPHIRREVANTLDLETLYRVHLEELHPSLPAEQTLPFIASSYVGGRGGYFYYTATLFSDITGDPQYAELARKVAYARILEGKTENAVIDVFMSSPFANLPADFDEQKTIAEVRRLYLESAAPKLLNGDFRQTRSYAEMMTPRVPGAVTPAWAKDVPYPRHWRIIFGKEFTATEFMRYRPELYSLGDGCMNILLDRAKWYSININMDSARIAFKPGVWNFSAKIRDGRNALPSRFSFTFTQFHGYRSAFQSPLTVPYAPYWAFRGENAPDLLKAECSQPDQEGFVTVQISFRIHEEGFGAVIFFPSLAPNAQKAVVTLKDLSFEPSE